MNNGQAVGALPPAPSNPAGHSPLRRPHSVRRTSSIDVTWPEGRAKQMRFDGRSRDIYTSATVGEPIVLEEDAFLAMLAPNRTIEFIAAAPTRPGISALVGVLGGGNLRRRLDEALPAERDAGSPLYMLLDDLTGSSLISGWAWSHWMKDWLKGYLPDDDDAARTLRHAQMNSICIGFRPGSSALNDIRLEHQNAHAVAPLPHPEDPEGWHKLTEHTQISMRRARRIDIWRDDRIHIDAMFQDSASVPEGGRVAIHEYMLHVTAHPETMELLSVDADPRILPYPECPAAVSNINRLVGLPMRNLRAAVLRELHHVHGCTHLNDALRALAEAPILAEHLGKAVNP